MGSRKPYHINRALNKWEEQNYQKLMERKIRGAKATISTGPPKPKASQSDAGAGPASSSSSSSSSTDSGQDCSGQQARGRSSASRSSGGGSSGDASQPDGPGGPGKPGRAQAVAGRPAFDASPLLARDVLPGKKPSTISEAVAQEARGSSGGGAAQPQPHEPPRQQHGQQSRIPPAPRRSSSAATAAAATAAPSPAAASGPAAARRRTSDSAGHRQGSQGGAAAAAIKGPPAGPSAKVVCRAQQGGSAQRQQQQEAAAAARDGAGVRVRLLLPSSPPTNLMGSNASRPWSSASSRYGPVVATTASPSSMAPAFTAGPGSPSGWGWCPAAGPSQLQSPGAACDPLASEPRECADERQPVPGRGGEAGPLHYNLSSGPAAGAAAAVAAAAAASASAASAASAAQQQAVASATAAAAPPPPAQPQAAPQPYDDLSRGLLPLDDDTTLYEDDGLAPEPIDGLPSEPAATVGTSPFASQRHTLSSTVVQAPDGSWGACSSRGGSDGGSSGPELEGAAELLRPSQMLRGGLGQSELAYLDSHKAGLWHQEGSGAVGAGQAESVPRGASPPGGRQQQHGQQLEQQRQQQAADGGGAGQVGGDEDDGVVLGDSATPHRIAAAAQGLEGSWGAAGSGGCGWSGGPVGPAEEAGPGGGQGREQGREVDYEDDFE